MPDYHMKHYLNNRHFTIATTNKFKFYDFIQSFNILLVDKVYIPLINYFLLLP